MSPRCLRAASLLLALAAAGCDGAGVEAEGLPSEFVLAGAAAAIDGGPLDGPYVPRPLEECYFDGDSRSSLSLDFSLLSGRLELASSGSFVLSLVGRDREAGGTERDTVRLAGPYERHGAILRLDLGDIGSLFATVGPDPTRPTTLHLGQATDVRVLSCDRLEFAVPGRSPEADVRGGAVDASFSVLAHDGQEYPYVVGRHGDLLRYDSARVDLSRDGRYTAQLWYDYTSRPEGAGVRRVTGRYIAEDPFYVFDPETALAALAVDNGGVVTLHQQSGWGQGFSGRLTMRKRR